MIIMGGGGETLAGILLWSLTKSVELMKKKFCENGSYYFQYQINIPIIDGCNNG